MISDELVKDKAILLYGGDITLFFNEKLHTYWTTNNNGDVILVPSMSAVLSAAINKSAPLMQWSANCAVDAMLAGASAEEAKVAFKSVSGAATDTGTVVHNWIEDFWKHPGMPPTIPEETEAANSVDAFLNWLSVNKVTPIATEKLLYSKKFKVAGTTDLIALVNDRLTVIDYKTSKKIYDQYGLQTAGYVYMLKEEMAYTKINHGYFGFNCGDLTREFSIKEPVFRTVIRVGKDGKLDVSPKNPLSIQENRKSLKEDMQALLHAVSLYRWITSKEMTKPKQAELDNIKWSSKYNLLCQGHKLF